MNLKYLRDMAAMLCVLCVSCTTCSKLKRRQRRTWISSPAPSSSLYSIADSWWTAWGEYECEMELGRRDLLLRPIQEERSQERRRSAPWMMDDEDGINPNPKAKVTWRRPGVGLATRMEARITAPRVFE